MKPGIVVELSCVVIYIAILVGVGLRFARRQTTTDRYFVAHRSVPGWAMGLSMFATIITAVTVIAYPGAAFAGNWSLLVPGFMVAGVLLLVGTVIIPFFRHIVGMSAYEYFGKRFSYGVRAYASSAFAVGHFSKMSIVLYLLGLTVSSITQWNIYAIVIGAGITTILYTLIGGMEAVVWTDVVQSIILWLGIAIVVFYLVALTPGGWPAAMHAATTAHKISLGSLSPSLSKPTVLVLTLYGFFFYLQKYTADQTLVQRYLIARTDKQAVRGVALGALLCIPVWTLFMLIGTLLWSYFQLSGDHVPLTLKKADQVFPYFLSSHITPMLAGIFLAALFGSAMASMASDLNCISVVFTQDFYRKARPRSTDAEALRFGKVAVAICGLLTIAFAAAMAHSTSGILSLYYTITGIVAGGLAGLFLLAFLCRRATTVGVTAGIVASLVFTAWATLTVNHGALIDLGRLNFPWNEYMIGVLGHLVLFAVGFLVSLFAGKTVAGSEDLTLYGWLRMKRTNHDLEAVHQTAEQPKNTRGQLSV